MNIWFSYADMYGKSNIFGRLKFILHDPNLNNKWLGKEIFKKYFFMRPSIPSMPVSDIELDFFFQYLDKFFDRLFFRVHFFRIIVCYKNDEPNLFMIFILQNAIHPFTCWMNNDGTKNRIISLFLSQTPSYWNIALTTRIFRCYRHIKSFVWLFTTFNIVLEVHASISIAYPFAIRQLCNRCNEMHVNVSASTIWKRGNLCINCIHKLKLIIASLHLRKYSHHQMK